MRFLPRILLFAALMMLFSSPALGSPNTQSASDGLIAFTSSRDGNQEIYVMNADGSSPVNLTMNPAQDWHPSWSPDGRRIIFNSDRDGFWQIYAMNADGSNQARLINEPGIFSTPSWSPDGSRIAFSAELGEGWQIYVADADGSNIQRLTTTGANKAHTAWSPDGRKVAFWQDSDGNNEIFVVSVDTGELTQLTQNDANDGWINWSPDSRHIAFDTFRDGNWEVYVMNTNGSNPVNLSNNSSVDGRPGWSPDSSQIVFTSDRDGNNDIWVMDADGGNPRRLTDSPADDNSPTWQPIPPKISVALDTVSAAEGGQVALPDGAVVYLPPDALTEDAGVMLTRTTFSESDFPPLGEDLLPLSDNYTVVLSNGDMTGTVMLGIPYDPALLPDNQEDGQLVVAKPGADGWELTPGIVDTDAHMTYFYMNDLQDPLNMWNFDPIVDVERYLEISPSAGQPGTVFSVDLPLHYIQKVDLTVMRIASEDELGPSGPTVHTDSYRPADIHKYDHVLFEIDTTGWQPGVYIFSVILEKDGSTYTFDNRVEIGGVTMPDLLGKHVNKAYDFFQANGLEFTVRPEYGNIFFVDRIVSQTPEAGTVLTLDDPPTIEVVKSIGPAPKPCEPSASQACARLYVLDSAARPLPATARLSLNAHGGFTFGEQARTDSDGSVTFSVVPGKYYYFFVGGKSPSGESVFWSNADCPFSLRESEIRDFYVVLGERNTTCATRSGLTPPLQAELTANGTQVTWNMLTELVDYDRLEWVVMRDDLTKATLDATNQYTLDLTQRDLFDDGGKPGSHVVRLDAYYAGSSHPISNQVTIVLDEATLAANQAILPPDMRLVMEWRSDLYKNGTLYEANYCVDRMTIEAVEMVDQETMKVRFHSSYPNGVEHCTFQEDAYALVNIYTASLVLEDETPVVTITKQGARVRSEPSTSGTVVYTANYGDELERRVDVENVQAGGYTWIPVIADGRDAWVAQSLVRIDDERPMGWGTFTGAGTAGGGTCQRDYTSWTFRTDWTLRRDLTLTYDCATGIRLREEGGEQLYYVDSGQPGPWYYDLTGRLIESNVPGVKPVQ